MSRLSLIAAIVATCMVLLGCGSSPEQEVRETVDTLYEAVLDKDYEKVCSLVVDGAREAIEEDGGCQKSVEQTEVDDAGVRAYDVRIDGNTATAQVQVKGESADRWRFVKSDGVWKVSSYAD